MKISTKFLLSGVLVVVLALMAAPLAAQDGPEGGVIIEGNLGGDPATFSPIIASDTASSRITEFLFPDLLSVDPSQAIIVPREGNPLASSAVVDSWDINEDGTVYTFNMRQDMVWSDGTPITSADVVYVWDAAVAGQEGIVDTPLSFIVAAPGEETGILDVQAVDDFTFEVTFASSACDALFDAASLEPVPSHIYPEDLSLINDFEENLNPTVTANVFSFGEFRPGEQVSLLADQNYIDADLGFVNLDGYIYRNVPDLNVIVEQYLAGELSVVDNPNVARRADIRADEGSQVYSYPGDRWDYLAFNLADPTNPQNGLDADGNAIDQGNHPLFGDVRVRQAIARAINVDAIIDAAVFGEGSRMTAHLIPASWAYHTELPPIAFDPEMAAEMLAEAGWADADGNGVLEATEDALYADAGTEFVFTLYTNEGNTRRTAMGTLVQDQLSQVGIQVDFQTIDFNTLLDIMDSQTFDTLILGWRNGYPDRPDSTQLFTPASDVVGSGSNFTSFNNAEFTSLNEQAQFVPGCDPAERAEFYFQMQEIMQEELPYVWMFAQDGMYAARTEVNGFDPFPAQLYWNIDTWSVRSAE
ncbi:MAG: hypothetical protein GYB67_03575 [Chloroflexi bacterium]|nr:hypothetical protein [Chloroflexota bacterium]